MANQTRKLRYIVHFLYNVLNFEKSTPSSIFNKIKALAVGFSMHSTHTVAIITSNSRFFNFLFTCQSCLPFLLLKILNKSLSLNPTEFNQVDCLDIEEKIIRAISIKVTCLSQTWLKDSASYQIQKPLDQFSLFRFILTLPVLKHQIPKLCFEVRIEVTLKPFQNNANVQK